MEKAKANWIITTGVEVWHTGESQMFRSKLFEPTLTGFSYRLFVEGLKSAVTKAAYTFALQKYMNFLELIILMI